MFYHLRSSLAYRYFAWKTRGLDATPPLVADPAAACEVHTMLGTRDVTMYLIAIKSLLACVPELRVVVHSDGSVTEKDRQRVARHIVHLRFIEPAQADARADTSLAAWPLLAEWRKKDAAYRRLMDVELWRAARKVIILDSDVLTNDDPREVADWIRAGTRPFLLGQSPRPVLAAAERPASHVQAQFLHRVPEISARLQKPPLFLQGTTAGFCGYIDEISLPLIEAALRTSIDVGLPMHQWGGDQCLVIYLLSIGGGTRLPEDRYINFEPSIRDSADAAAVIHFYGTHRFEAGVYPRLAAACVHRLSQDRSPARSKP
jgi:hypothetical protein